jgi:hypothetical protein
VEDHGQLVHQGDVQIALRVLDDLGRLRRLDAGGAVDAGLHDEPVHLGEAGGDVGGLPRHDLDHAIERVLRIARVDALWRIPDVKVDSCAEPGRVLEDRHADLFGRPWVDRGLEDDHGTARQVSAHRAARRAKRAKIGSPVLVHGRRDGDDDDIGGAELRGIGGEFQAGRLEIFRLHFAGTVVAVLQLADALG